MKNRKVFNKSNPFYMVRNPQKKKAKNLVLVLDESAADLPALYFGFNATNAQLTESMHLELIRIMTLYITGYDAPDLKTGILRNPVLRCNPYPSMAKLLFHPVKIRRLQFLIL